MSSDCYSVHFGYVFVDKEHPVSKYLFKVSKITLEQRPDGRCSNVILMTLNRYLPTGTAWNTAEIRPCLFSYEECPPYKSNTQSVHIREYTGPFGSAFYAVLKAMGLQNCYCVCGHFGTAGIKWLIYKAYV